MIMFVGFTDEEKVIINAVCKGQNLIDFTHEDAINELMLMETVSPNEMKELVSDTLEKVRKLSDEEWDELKMRTPLFVSFPDPEDEDYDFAPEVDDEPV